MTEQTTLISEELTLAGEASPITPEIIALNSHRITTVTQLKDQEYLFRLQDKPCFPRCDVTTITGPAKSGKTFFVSMLMACCAERQVLALERVREEPLSVLWLDTEQSLQSTKDILAGRIAKLVQTPFPDERFYVFNVRSATYKERREMMALAIETYRPDLVILDNISDLSFDINSDTVKKSFSRRQDIPKGAVKAKFTVLKLKPEDNPKIDRFSPEASRQ